ncbi:hypothetical protein HPB48_016128 [Haemaphysalis longicornis]|uniref:Uncharacterized protein n=1 Tax=Haemaphysalis longicornis TaxID=44386 RepID=A0A9J6GTD2_HAELO|nr:hypothetical protein HPB48_016128 [Haemaphysalis longicornis]
MYAPILKTQYMPRVWNENPQGNDTCENPKSSAEARPTADKACKARFNTRYLICKRRWKRQHLSEEKDQQLMKQLASSLTPSREPAQQQATARGTGQRRNRSKTRRDRSKSATKSPSTTGIPWRENTRGPSRSPGGATTPHARLPPS